MNKPLILFDGVCNLCAWAVRFIIARDPGERFQFASLQSPLGRQLTATYGLATDPESVVLIDAGRCYTESDAALRIARSLRAPWPVFGLALWVPRWLRDPLYKVVARNRYRIFGKQEACMVPDSSVTARFRDR